MELIADLHIHSRYAQACSKNITIENLEQGARVKGINILGTGDFTHPKWIKDLKEKLTPNENNILHTKTGFPFLLQTEISLIYTDESKGRRTHNLVLAPDFEVVDQITEYLLKYGRIDYDGRPIFKIPCPDFVESLREINKDIEIIPAHAWTPWFSVFGSKSGWNSLKDCFKDQTKHIHAIETGLSSDPPMNWRIPSLDKINLVSFSDMHSYHPWRIGREATIFDCKLTYKDIVNAVRTGDGLASTIEVNPNYGKYHIDGHRACNIVMNPDQSKKHNGICPKCHKPLTIGVLNRVEELAERPEGYIKKDAKPFHSLLPLCELISLVLAKGLNTKTIQDEYQKIMKLGDEFSILMNTPKETLLSATNSKIADAILVNRAGALKFKPGYDGVYGTPLFTKAAVKQAEDELSKEYTPLQRSLGEF